MKPSISLIFITDGICNVSCKTCATGRKESGGSKRMSLDMFKRILDKSCDEANVLVGTTYLLNEPMLHPDMPEMVKLINEKGIYSFVSSNLSFAENSEPMNRVRKMMANEPSNLIVSTSGFSQPIYERSHKNGNIEFVKKNMIEVAKLKTKNTFLRLSWHVYNYNQHEMEEMRKFSEDLGYIFTPYTTGILALEPVFKTWRTRIPHPSEEDLLNKVLDVWPECYKRRRWQCQLQDQTICVDYAGTIWNCSGYNSPETYRGSFFDRSIPQILKERKRDYQCLECKAVGGHIYAQQEYSTPLWSARRWFEMVYKKTGAQWYLKQIFPKTWKRMLEGWYNRPQKNEN